MTADFNDAVLCMTGAFSSLAVSQAGVYSMIDQTIPGRVSNLSACDHDMIVKVTGPGNYIWVRQFRTKTPPTLQIPFKQGSRLDVQLNPVSPCNDNGTGAGKVWVSMYNLDWARIRTTCNTTGN